MKTSLFFAIVGLCLVFQAQAGSVSDTACQAPSASLLFRSNFGRLDTVTYASAQDRNGRICSITPAEFIQAVYDNGSSLVLRVCGGVFAIYEYGTEKEIFTFLRDGLHMEEFGTCISGARH